LKHVRYVFRLLSEVRDLGSSPLVWRQRMVAGLRQLVGGSTGVAAEAVIPQQPGTQRLLGVVVEGVNDPRLVAIYRALMERGGLPLDFRRQALAGPASSTLVRTRRQMAENRAWRDRPDLDPWRALDCEHFICSNQYLPQRGCVHLIILTRAGRERPFEELERRIVGLFHGELGRLWRQTLDAGPPAGPGWRGATAAAPPQATCQGQAARESEADLPSNLLRTLELLLEGCSERQIVARLDLSSHTVHDHVKRLYRRFQVNSRAQLLARLSHCPLVRAPRLCVDLLKRGETPRLDAADLAAGDPGGGARAGAAPESAAGQARAGSHGRPDNGQDARTRREAARTTREAARTSREDARATRQDADTTRQAARTTGPDARTTC
jgi:DNA-binding CsgD family transcriptional regulator